MSVTIAEAKERLRLLEFELTTCASPEQRKVLQKRIAHLQKRIGWACHVEELNLYGLPSDGEEMITFRLGADGSMSESRHVGRHWEYGADQALWPSYIQRVARHMEERRAGEGRPNITPWIWIVRVKDLKQVLN